MRASAPFYQIFGNAQFRLLRNADDPAKFIQVIEYETHEALELNRQNIAGDLRMQAYLQAWRAMLPARWRSTSIRKCNLAEEDNNNQIV